MLVCVCVCVCVKQTILNDNMKHLDLMYSINFFTAVSYRITTEIPLFMWQSQSKETSA